MEQLKKSKIWLCADIKPAQDRTHLVKTPVAAYGGVSGTSKKYMNTWVPYEEAAKYAEAHGYNTGFVIPAGYFFLDIDHKSEKDPFVQDILNRFNTYAEISVSGEGIHIYGKCDINRLPINITDDGKTVLDNQYYVKNPHNGLELYIGDLTNRYAVYTGNAIKNFPVLDCTDAVLQTLESDMRKSGVSSRTYIADKRMFVERSEDILSIVESIKKQKNGDKFSKLYFNGDYSDYPSHSEADAALCAIIAFRVGDNPQIIDEVFKSSALFREKWRRKDYRDRTIQAGINVCQNRFYSPSVKNEMYERNEDNQTADKYPKMNCTGITEIDSKAIKISNTESLEPIDYTDVGQKNVFVREYGEIIKYTAATKFLVYSGAVWEESEIKAQGLSQKLTERQLTEALDRVSEAEDQVNKAERKGNIELINRAKQYLKKELEYKRYVFNRRATARIQSTLIEARPDIELKVSELDNDGYILNTPSGTINLKSGEIRANDPNDYCTKITSVSMGTKNESVFNDFLYKLTCGDRELEEYLQCIAGMCAIGHVLNENLIIAYGEGGNGKSTFFNLLSHVLGDYAGLLSSETLTSNCRKNKSPEYAELRGKRMIISAELEEGVRLDTSVVKKLCSTDPITAEKKYKDPFSFIPSHTVILYTNHLPKIGTNDSGTWDRIVVIPFYARFRNTKEEKKNYAEILYEQCGGAVLRWIVEGAKKFIGNNYCLSAPKCVRQAVDEYRSDNDWLQIFLDECCEMHCSYIQKSGDLFEYYKQYCDRTGEYRRSVAEFKQSLKAHGFESKKTKKGTLIYGLRLAIDTS